MKKYKIATEEDVFKVLNKKFNVAFLNNIQKNKTGQFEVPDESIAIDGNNTIVVFLYCRGVKIGRRANKLLKKYGYYSRIIRVRVHSLALWVAINPKENKEKYGSFM